MKITLCLPAILDEKLISKTTETIRKNIINCNPKVEFDILEMKVTLKDYSLIKPEVA